MGLSWEIILSFNFNKNGFCKKFFLKKKKKRTVLGLSSFLHPKVGHKTGLIIRNGKLGC
jgi:hypothetical protein